MTHDSMGQINLLNTTIVDIANGTEINGTAINTAITYTFAGLSTFAYILITTLLILYSRGFRVLQESSLNVGIIAFSTLVTIITGPSLGDTLLRNVYVVTVSVSFGTLLNVYGCVSLFDTPGKNEASLGFGNANRMSLIVFGVSLPLSLMELFFAIGALTLGKSGLAVEIVAVLLQKMIQAATYHFSLRLKKPKENMYQGASWYLKIIALFNLGMWISSIVDTQTIILSCIEDLAGETASVVSQIYAALVIDYRLLCTLLFAELSLQVDNWPEHSKMFEGERNYNRERENQNGTEFKVSATEYTGGGVITGLIICLVQFLNILQYVGKSSKWAFGPWVNIFGIIANLTVTITGVMIIRMTKSSKKSENPHELHSRGIEFMVGFMGLVGLTFWILRFTMTTLITIHIYTSPSIKGDYEYIVWNDVKYVFWILGLICQLFFFCRLSPTIGFQRELRESKLAYLLLPLMTLCQLAVFINSIIDSYSGIIEGFVEEVELSPLLATLYKLGEPLHLGFCLHMCFHLFTITNNLRITSTKREAKKTDKKGEKIRSYSDSQQTKPLLTEQEPTSSSYIKTEIQIHAHPKV